MSVSLGGFRTAFASAILLACAVLPAQGQTSYPSFQQPRVVSREYNFAIADGDGITAFAFQWREGTSVGTQLSFDAGLADPEADGADVALMLGGQFARSLARSRPDMPLDVLFTAGVFTQLSNDVTVLSIPVGASIGHRFPIEGTGMAITPYIHPRLALQYVSFDNDVANGSDTDLDISFDLGGNLDLTPQLALRLSATFGDADAIGLSLAYTPGGLRTPGTTPGATR